MNSLAFKFHPSFFLLLFLLFLMGNGLLAIMFACFSLMHELSHCWVAKMLGYRPVCIFACLFGGRLKLYESEVAPADGLLVHLSGPFSNLLAGSLFYLADIAFPTYYFKAAIFSNLALALFNLLPFYPLDGGRVVNIYLLHFLNAERAERISGIISVIFLITLFIFGIYLIQYNLINMLIPALAINLYLAGKEDSRYSYGKLKKIYKQLERENRI